MNLRNSKTDCFTAHTHYFQHCFSYSAARIFSLLPEIFDCLPLNLKRITHIKKSSIAENLIIK